MHTDRTERYYRSKERYYRLGGCGHLKTTGEEAKTPERYYRWGER
jgi:hypothetical protein